MRNAPKDSSRGMPVAVAATAVLAALLVLVGPAPASAQQQDEEPVSLTDTIPDAELAVMIETGSDVFNEGTCTICHAVGGRSAGDRAPDFTDVEWLHSDGSFEGIFQTIVWGVKRDEMKAVEPRPFFMSPSGGMTLTGQERLAVAAYVWSLGPDRQDRQPPRVAAQNEFLDLLERGAADEAIALFEREGRRDPESMLFDEGALNRLGYAFLGKGARRTAFEIFELNTELHPDSWNVWDSLGEAHMEAGNRQRAIELYERSLELNPENDNAREKLAELREG